MNTQLAYSIAEACSVARAILAGELRAVKRGRRTLVLADDLRDWLDNLPTVKPMPPRRGGLTATGR